MLWRREESWNTCYESTTLLYSFIVILINNYFQEHDSFRSFRSQNLNISIALETKLVTNRSAAEFDCPAALLYGSTLRYVVIRF